MVEVSELGNMAPWRRERNHAKNSEDPVTIGSPYKVKGVERGYGNSVQSIVAGPGQFNRDISPEKQAKVVGIREASKIMLDTMPWQQ
jgi:hypothetical protein